jgi:hypothetical protein
MLRHWRARSLSLALRPPWALASNFQFHGLLVRVISPSQGLYLNTGQHKHRINAYTRQTPMPCVGFKPTIPASERAKTVCVLDRSATVTGNYLLNHKIYEKRAFIIKFVVYVTA